MSQDFFQQRIVRPVLDLMRQGTSPEEIALNIAFGLVLGIFPSLGWTTLLCLLAAVIFRLNLPAVQLVNYFAYPLQLAMLIPFIRAGEFLFHSDRLPLSLTQIVAMIKADVWHSITALWVVTVHAIAAWALMAPLAIYVLSLILSPLLRRLARASGLSGTKKLPAGAVGTEAC
jgi:uncharacterized protein (DUF2062 family)